MPEPKYDENLYRDIENKMKGMTEEEKAGFMLELAILYEMTSEEQQQAFDNHIKAYMIPLNDDGELDKELFEERIGTLEKVRMEKIAVPFGEIALQNKQEHSDKWIYDYVNSCTKEGALQGNYQSNLAFGIWSDKKLPEVVENAYPDVIEDAKKIYERLQIKKRAELLEAWPEKTKKIVIEGLRYVALENGIEEGKTKEELKEQKEKRKQDQLMDMNQQADEFAKAVYATVRDMDLSYIQDHDTYKKIRKQIRERSSSQRRKEEWEAERSVDQNLDALASNLDNIAVSLKEISGYRWRDSKEFNQIKDDLAELQKKLQKGSSREGREAIMESLAKFSKDCKAYQEKNPGVRKTDRGNQRKQLVAGIQGILDDQLQKIMAPELEAEREEIMKRQNEKVSMELAKESLKREKVDSKEFLNEGRKTISSRPVQKKEKEPELGRKSLEPKQLSK